MKMHLIQFVSIVNWIQMKSMKAIHKMKNILNQEFEQLKESKLIEVMKMKMHLIQFVSIVNWIQMKLMKVIHNMTRTEGSERNVHWRVALMRCPSSVVYCSASGAFARTNVMQGRMRIQLLIRL
jgi:hypothetical protein